MFHGISIDHWVEIVLLVGGFLGTVLGIVSPRLQAQAQKWLNQIGGQQAVEQLLRQAAAFYGMSGAQRFDWAVAEVQKLAKQFCGFPMPESIARLIVEWVYNKIKSQLKAIPADMKPPAVALQ